MTIATLTLFAALAVNVPFCAFLLRSLPFSDWCYHLRYWWLINRANLIAALIHRTILLLLLIGLFVGMWLLSYHGLILY
ncbi:hypothetical protein [Spirosoma endbachense]|uniref:Uncharacterized protein n=1 Tax=Spirosoma endbachense TaxID=2666025 RepID=A0A6P1VXA6_9BACT|nr:hypothetical protein [Spirosoma endbachense]QHV96329.1 hypothetical protein GJR95_15450 [Spirosoma endbachense]